MEYELEFEKPIIELERKLDEMKRLAIENNVNVQAATEALEVKILELKKSIFANLSPWQRVQLSRHPMRPYTLDYIYALTTDFIELFGDRLGKDDKAIVGGFGKLNNNTVMFIGHQKGRDTKSRQYRNFGMANPEGYRKALRLMKLAEKFNKPILTLIDTPGAYPGLSAEEHGQAEAIARNLFEMSTLRVPIICVVIGEGASGGALGIGIGDRIFMLENTWYSVISPESCSSILWRSWSFKEKAAEALHLTAKDNLELGIIDAVIEEPLGGAHKNPNQMFKILKSVIDTEFANLHQLSIDELINQRLDKFSKMGMYQVKE